MTKHHRNDTKRNDTKHNPHFCDIKGDPGRCFWSVQAASGGRRVFVEHSIESFRSGSYIVLLFQCRRGNQLGR
jgi:hypothetical protein